MASAKGLGQTAQAELYDALLSRGVAESERTGGDLGTLPYQYQQSAAGVNADTHVNPDTVGMSLPEGVGRAAEYAMDVPTKMGEYAAENTSRLGAPPVLGAMAGFGLWGAGEMASGGTGAAKAAAKAVLEREALESARLLRAEKAGWGMAPKERFYHGTTRDFDEFRPSGHGGLGPGVYTSNDTFTANAYAGETAGSRVIPLVTPRGGFFRLEGRVDTAALDKISAGLRAEGLDTEKAMTAIRDARESLGGTPKTNGDLRGELLDAISWKNIEDITARKKSSHEPAVSTFSRVLRKAGFNGMDSTIGKNTTRVVFEPHNLRSPWAQFDPKNRGSANILHSAVAGALGVGGAAAAQGDDNAKPGEN